MLTTDQKNERRTGIGGSDCAAIMGLSRWKTPLDVWREKVYELEENEELKNNERIHFGNKLESIVADEFSERTGLELKEVGMKRSEKYPWMIANIDRFICDEGIPLECKTADKFLANDWGEEGTDQIPREYLYQCAHYAIVYNVDRVQIAVLIGGNNFRMYEYKKNNDIEESIIRTQEYFWNEYVLKNKMPPPSTLKEVSNLYPQDHGNERIITDQEDLILSELKKTRERINKLNNKKEQLELGIKMNMQDCAYLSNSDGDVVASWKTQRTNKFKTKNFSKDNPDLYKKYVEENETRVFRIK